MNQAISDLRATILPISVDYSNVQASLPPHHGDPFDRLIIAQCIVEEISVISNDTAFDLYGASRLW